MGSKSFAVFAAFLTVLLIGQATIDSMAGRIMAVVGECGMWCVMIATVFNKEENEEEDEREDG